MIDLGKRGVSSKRVMLRANAKRKMHTMRRGYLQRYSGVAGPKRRRVSSGLGEVIGRASQLLGSKEVALEWLKKPSLWLDNRSPLDMIQAGEREDVDRYLKQIEYGVYV